MTNSERCTGTATRTSVAAGPKRILGGLFVATLLMAGAAPAAKAAVTADVVAMDQVIV